MNFEVVIRNCAKKAVAMQMDEHEKHDHAALLAVRDRGYPGRPDIVHEWLRYYGVFQGFTGSKRRDLTDALLAWSDARDLQQGLGGAQAIVEAHSDVMAVCDKRCEVRRGFTSLASKYLWLCYPMSIPLYDKNVRRALQVLSKTEAGNAWPEASLSQYHQFVLVWRTFYERHLKTLEEIDLGSYPYAVRIFDKILWLVGEETYGLQ